jgi:hypothetical protein
MSPCQMRRIYRVNEKYMVKPTEAETISQYKEKKTLLTQVFCSAVPSYVAFDD